MQIVIFFTLLLSSLGKINVFHLFTLFFIKAIGGGGQGSIFHVKLISKFQTQGCQRFLRNVIILARLENMAVSIFGPPYFSIVKFDEK